MPLLTFLLEAVLISLSGVLMPGPITAITVAKGNESPHAGAFIAAGHGVVEIPLMISIYYGFGYLLNMFYVKTVIAFVGGLFLLFMAYSMFRSITQVEFRSGKYTHSLSSPFHALNLISLISHSPLSLYTKPKS